MEMTIVMESNLREKRFIFDLIRFPTLLSFVVISLSLPLSTQKALTIRCDTHLKKLS